MLIYLPQCVDYNMNSIYLQGKRSYHYYMKIFSILGLLLSVCTASIKAQYFPTGMTWEEIIVVPFMEPEAFDVWLYEIDTDTLVGNVAYKKVMRNKEFSGICIREDGDKVWLLTKDYPTEILLYNFDWDTNCEIVTEYLKAQNNGGYELRRDTIHVGDCPSVIINGKNYQYFREDFTRSLIRGIGKVTELNRYPCFLGYREGLAIRPGLEFLKVHWIQRNGVEIYRSEDPKEWTVDVPTGIDSDKSINNPPSPTYDLQGRPLTGKPSKGVYIEDGKKRVVK